MFSLIFHGRSIGLQKCRNSRILVKFLDISSPFSKSFSSVAAAADLSRRDGPKDKNFTVSSYLINSLGLSRKLAESISRKVSFEDKGDPDSVLSLLRSHGFTDSQISSMVTNYPRLLIADAEKSLAPKLQFLQSKGASSSELTEIVSKVPKILGIKRNKAFSVYYDFIKDIIEADKSSTSKKFCHSSLPQGIALENKLRNVSVLRDLGVPQRFLFPLLMSGCTYVCGKEKFEETLTKVVELGFDPTSPKFVQALAILYKISDQVIEEKINIYKRFGFSVEDVWAVFKMFPNFLIYSEKRIVPRCNVIKALMSKGLIGNKLPSLTYVLVCPDEKFLDTYVRKHDDKELVAELMAIFSTYEC